MINSIESRVLSLRSAQSFRFTKKGVGQVVDDYSKFRKKAYLGELKRVTLSSLDDGGLRVFEGAPGTGKSRVLHIYALLGLMQGRNIVVSAHNYRETQKLSAFIRKLAIGFGLKCRGRIKHVKFSDLKSLKPPSGSVLLIDEAGFLPVDTVKKVLDAAAASASLVVIVGDLYQIGLKAEKNGFLHIMDILHRHSHKTRELTEIFRQRNPYDIEAIHNIRRAKVKEALDYYFQRSDYEGLRFYKDGKSLAGKLLADIKAIKPKDYVVIVSNRKLQGYLKERFSEKDVKAQILLPKDVQGMAVNQSFFALSQKNIGINELLVAFSRHKYKMRTYVDSSAGQKDVDGLVASVKFNNEGE